LIALLQVERRLKAHCSNSTRGSIYIFNPCHPALPIVPVNANS
jgi:hypothetical protein